MAEEAHDRKLQKSLAVCEKEGIHFVPLAWESTGGATETVHETVRKWTELEGARGSYPAYLIRRNPCAQISCADSDRSSLGARLRSRVVRGR